MRSRLSPALLALFSFFLFSTLTFSGPIEDCAEYTKLGVPGTKNIILPQEIWDGCINKKVQET